MFCKEKHRHPKESHLKYPVIKHRLREIRQRASRSEDLRCGTRRQMRRKRKGVDFYGKRTDAEFCMRTYRFLRWPSFGGGGFVAGKASLSGFSPMAVVALRFCGAALLSALLFFRILRKSDGRVIRHGLLLGVIQFAAQGIQLLGLKYTTPGKQAFLIAGYVVLVPFLLWIIMRKRPAVSSFAAGVVALTGIALLSLNERLTMGAGEILTLISTGAFALQLILIGLFAKEDNPIQLTFSSLSLRGRLRRFSL